jgi:hypothetical protein
MYNIIMKYKRVSILGIIFFPSLMATIHSINKRIALGEVPITGGRLWLWQTGWWLLGITIIGPWVYCAVKHREMNETRRVIAEQNTK